MEEKSKLSIESILIFVLALIGLAVLVYNIQVIISPIIVFITLLIILVPIRKQKPFNIIFNIVIFLFLLWLIFSLKSALMPFIIAFVLAYLCDPFVDLLMKLKLSRTISIIIVLLLIIGVIVLILSFLLPPFVNQISILISNIPYTVQSFEYWLQNDLLKILEKFGVPSSNVQTFLDTHILPSLEKSINKILNSLISIFSQLGVVLSQLINIVIIPILTFYFLKDYDNIIKKFKSIIPIKHKENVEDVFSKFDIIVGKYIRGAITIAVINMIIVTTALSINGIQYSIVLGILSGVMTLIPYFGIFIAFGIGMIVSIISGVGTINLIFVPIIYFGENFIETSILYPKIVGAKVGLHPLLIILSISVFGYFFGLFGMLVAVPCTSVIMLLLKENFYKENDSLTGDI